MSKNINELAEIVLGHVYKLGYQHRSDIGKHQETAAELVAVQRKLRETDQELQWLRQRHVEVQSEEVAAARAEVETLRQQLANAQQELSEQGQVHGVELQRETADLRKQLDAAQAALTRERLDAEERGREMERLRAFVATIKAMMAVPLNGREFDEIGAALDELDAGTAEPTPVAERCPECDESGMVDSGGFTPDGKGINVPCGGDCRGNKCPSEPAPVAEPLDAEGGQ